MHVVLVSESPSKVAVRFLAKATAIGAYAYSLIARASLYDA